MTSVSYAFAHTVQDTIRGRLVKKLPTEAKPRCAGYMLFVIAVHGASQRYVVSTVLDAYSVIRDAPLQAELILTVIPARPYPSVAEAQFAPTANA